MEIYSLFTGMFRLVFIFLLLNSTVHAQELLVNGSFELENICTEYSVNCSPEGWISSNEAFNNYRKEADRAYDGYHFMSILAGHAREKYKRTFIRSRLLCALRAGNRYRIEMKLKSLHPILDSFGVSFSNNDPLFSRNRLQIMKPKMYVADAITQPVKRDTNWQHVVFEFTATGDEYFISLANFSQRDITGPTGLQMENNYFIYLDRISFTPVDKNEKRCDNWHLVREEIFDQNERHEVLERTILYYKNNRNKQPPKILQYPTIVQQVDTLILPDILFATGSAALKPAMKKILDSLQQKLAFVTLDSIIIEGHTDNQGTMAKNEVLSTDRANAVSAYLNIKNSYSRGWASTKPVSSNATAAGRQRNRRVEILIYIRK